MLKFSILIIVFILCLLIGSTESTLRLVHVIFKHGDRTPNLMYPKDPHINETFYPYERGQLTNTGQLRAYKLGKALRNRYETFLGRLYQLSIVESLSSSSSVTKTTLALVLAGLFPPCNTSLHWSDELNWQPILYNSVDHFNDHLLTAPLYNCPRYTQYYTEFLSSSQGLTIRNRYRSLFYYLTKHTGWYVTTNLDILNLYNTLVSEADFGLQLPVWAQNIFPNILNKAAGKENAISTFTREMRQLSGGFLLKKIINDALSKLNSTLTPQNRKIFLYSGNDGTIARFLGALQLFNPHVPPYCAYVLMELHEIQHVYGFKIFYHNYFTNKPVLLTLSGCYEFCPVDQFIKLLQDNLPANDNACNIET